MAQPPTRPRLHGRRTMLILIGSVVFLIAGLLAVAGAFTLINLRGGAKANVSSTVPPDLPATVFICDNFRPDHSVVADGDGGGRHYQVVGDCPVSALEIQDAYVSELEYRGWTVHSSDDGTITAYNYGAKQTLFINFGESSSSPNQSALTLEVLTRDPTPPSGFPTPGALSPTPR